MKNKPKLEINSIGDKFWILNGKYHREDGPAIEYTNGNKSWWLNGEYHRKDGPAFEYVNGDKEWWLNGKLHRENGPAIECYNGRKSWFLNGKEVTEEEVMIDFNPDITERQYLEFVINLKEH